MYILLGTKAQDMFLRLPECRFCTNRARNRLQKLLSACFSFAIPVDRAREASWVGFPFNADCLSSLCMSVCSGSRSGGGDNVEGDVMVARKGHQSD